MTSSSTKRALRRPIVALLALNLLLAGCGDEDAVDEDPVPQTATSETTSASTTTVAAVTTSTVDPNIQVAEAAIAAWNTQVPDAFFAAFGPDGVFDGKSMSDQDLQDDLGFWMGLGDKVVVEGCVTDDLGRVICESTSSDDLSGPAGATLSFAFVFSSIEDDKIARAGLNLHPATGKDKITFTLAMVRWLQDTYPEVWESTFAADGGCTFPESYNCYESSWYGSAEAAAVLLDLVDEFMPVADDYWMQGAGG